jgi:DNA mismatch repair protein MutS
MAPFSLLVPDGGEFAGRDRLSAEAIHDLELPALVRAMMHRGISESALLRVLSELPHSPDEIRYRQDTARCLWNNERFCTDLDELARMMQELTVFSRSVRDTERPLLEAVWRLGELELYVILVCRMQEVLEQIPARSAAFTKLYHELVSRRADPAFKELQRELPRLRAGIKLHQSVTVGVNLDDKLRPVQAALLSINEKRFKEGHFLGRFFGKATGDPFVTQTALSSTPGLTAVSGTGEDNMPLAPLFEELDAVLRSMLRPLARKLRDYVGVNTEIFRRLFPELACFLGAVKYFRGISRAGYPVCFPMVLDPDRRVTRFRGLYNVRLASHWLSRSGAGRMVGNDVSLDDESRVFVLTGPNGGGKTTFTQAVGIATVLAQVGLPIPAQSGEIAPVDTIHTHFPAEEDFDDELGRFEDEARRISALFDRVTPTSMVLMNEPLASTGPQEAERIGESVLSGLCMVGARGIVTTHLHELARGAGQINRDPSMTSMAGTLNAGVRYEGGRATRTYEITAGPPAGSSFADDVARRYRIDADSLGRRILGRPIASDDSNTHRDLA